MQKEIIIPSPGESITQVQLAKWLVSEGETVEKDQEVVEIDSDKASFPLTAEAPGKISLKAVEGDTLAVGTVIAVIEVMEGAAAAPPPKPVAEAPVKPAPATHEPSQPARKPSATPLAMKVMEEKKIDPGIVAQSIPGKKITRKELEAFILERKTQPSPMTGGSREIEHRKLSTLRLKLAERLVAVRNETAMLTTFNEVNMRAIQRIREKYNDAFREKYGVNLGLMSFFARAATIALQEFPQVNSMIEGDDLLVPKYVDIGIAVSAPKGLVVPVLRNTEQMGFADIELRIRDLAGRARENRITIDEMKGGTFTITNGGVFGSMMSTPILNPPQSAILGMHKIMDRPVAVEGRVEIHPMMYLALSYDHRVIDGRESVSFLVRIKEMLEDPSRLLTFGEPPEKILLDL